MCYLSCVGRHVFFFPFSQVKATELASVQRLEAAELRKQEEKARRLEQARARATAETHLREKVAAATFARGYIKGETVLRCTFTCASKPGCLMSHIWLHTPDCKA